MSSKLRLFSMLAILFSQTACFASQAEVQNISSDKYFEATLNEINSAKSTLLVAMYLISIFPSQPDSRASRLVNALIQAKDRGVSVKVILDQNIDFASEAADAATGKNHEAYEILKKNNVPVFFDTADIYTHAKAIVIDRETVILGSTNWSESALTRNNEADALVRSKEFAKNLLEDLNKIKLEETPVVTEESVAAPKAFLTDAKLFGQIVTHGAERALDVYLYILKCKSEILRLGAARLAQDDVKGADPKIDVNLQKLAGSLGIEGMGNEAYRRQILKVLGKLKNEYGLIDFEDVKLNQDAEIIVKDLTQAGSFEIPMNYFKYAWNRRLALPAKAFYLINLSKSSGSSPSWRLSREAISESYHISDTFISDGVRELRQQNLLDVQYGAIEPEDLKHAFPNTYAALELYDPAELEAKFKALETKRGKEKMDRARRNAAIVFGENNLDTLTALADLEDKYGQSVVEEAAKKIAAKNTDNPKRSVAYFIATIKNITHSGR